jgi:hypothetical protein
MYIFVSLIAGVVAGQVIKTPKVRFHKFTGIIFAILFFLMGIQLGSVGEVWQDIETIGITTVLLTLFSITGSIIFSGIYWHFTQKLQT